MLQFFSPQLVDILISILLKTFGIVRWLGFLGTSCHKPINQVIVKTEKKIAFQRWTLKLFQVVDRIIIRIF